MRLVKTLAKTAVENALSAFGLERTYAEGGWEWTQLGRVGTDPLRDLRRILKIPKFGVIFDVGANRGQTALEYSRAFPGYRIHSFEPDPETCAILRLEARNASSVTPHCIGLGPQDGEAQLILTRRSEGNSLLTPLTRDGVEWTEPKGEVIVPIRRLDTFCSDHNIVGLDLLKIDTQGYELAVLQGSGDLLQPDRIRSLFVEMQFEPLYASQAYFHELYSLLLKKGYRLVDLYNKYRRSDGTLRWCDGLFV